MVAQKNTFTGSCGLNLELTHFWKIVFTKKTHNNPTNTWATQGPKPNLRYRRKLILAIQWVGFGDILL